MKTLYAMVILILLTAAWAYHTPMDIAVRARGVVRPEGEVVKVIAHAGGRVTRVYAREGDQVHRGDPLIQLNTGEVLLRRKAVESKIHFTELRLEALEQQAQDISSLDAQSEALEAFEKDSLQQAAKVSLDQAALRFDRSEELLREGLISRQVHEESRSELAQAQVEHSRITSRTLDLKRAQSAARLRQLSFDATPLHAELSSLYHELDQARLDLDRLTISSPVGGKISSLVTIHTGEILSAGSIVALLIPDSPHLVVESWLAAQDRGFIEPGQVVRLRNNEDFYEGTILSISADTNEGAYRVSITPQREDLLIGMTLDVHYITRRERLLYLPFIRVIRAVRGQ